MSDKPSVVIYSQPNCVACKATYRTLDKKGIPYSVVDVSLPENSEDLAKIKALGYSQVPVVVYGESHWSGFNLEKINQIA